MTRKASRLCPAIISSFSVTGSDPDYDAIPPECEYVEAYCFMQRCLPGNTTSLNAVRHLADLHHQGKIDEVVNSLEERFRGKKIAALATFAPELTAKEGRNSDFENAYHALMLLIDVVRVLQVRGHPVNTIELVSGSRIKSISREPGSASTCFVHRLTQSTAMSLLISRLKEVAAYAYRPTPVFLAVELEPGPLFILSSPNSVTRFCKLIDDSKDEALKRCVGLNLDIPHWHFLAGILPEWLEAPENKAVYRRIAHAHICDHHIGHFCDLVPMTFNSKGTFLRWFSFLHQLSSEKRPVGLPKFSRFVSCEMEACTDKRLVQNCYQRVSELLAYNSATTRPKVVSRNQIARRAEA